MTIGRPPSGCALVALIQGVDPEALVVLVILPDAPEVRHHFSGEELCRIARLFRRHVAHVNEAHDVADGQCLDQLFHALAHGLGAAGDDIVALDQLAPGNGSPPRRDWGVLFWTGEEILGWYLVKPAPGDHRQPADQNTSGSVRRTQRPSFTTARKDELAP